MKEISDGLLMSWANCTCQIDNLKKEKYFGRSNYCGTVSKSSLDSEIGNRK